MLAKTPLSELALSAKELGIREWERAGLLEFVHWVDAGMIDEKFDHRDCGACIGYHVYYFHKPRARHRAAILYVEEIDNPLEKLYFPDRFAKDAREAALMVRGFLMFGTVPVMQVE
jgi:hypothetical protein